MNKIKKNLKVVILAGGYGTRLSEYTKKIPKPMVQINRKPLLVHIINHYKKFGFKEFIIAAGYKKEVISDYFSEKSDANFLKRSNISFPLSLSAGT